MSNTLYRKYRPANFDELIGQDLIVNLLSSSISEQNPAHAYLFCGSRGTGKTTTARIFARALGISDEDIVEIDAASYRGIDDIRTLRDSVHTLPFSSPYRIYIIDEVHMLTAEAFNALLKTLEEPPTHILFILATTDAHRVPETIVSRCQTCNFTKPDITTLANTIKRVADGEDIVLDAESMRLIAIYGDGSYRNALVALQKVIAVVEGEKINSDLTSSVLGIPPLGLIIEFCNACVSGDPAGLAALSQMRDNGYEEKYFLDTMVDLVRDTLLLRQGIGIADTQEKYSDVNFQKIKEMSNDNAVNSKFLLRLLEQYEVMNMAASHPFLAAELLILERINEK